MTGTLVIHPGPLGDLLLSVPALRALRAQRPADPLLLAAQPRLGALLAALGVIDRHLSFEKLAIASLFVDDGAPAEVAPLRGASRIVCWFGAGDPVFGRRLRELWPEAVVASPTGDQTEPVWQHLLRTVDAPAGDWRAAVTVPAPLVAAGRAALARAGWDGDASLVIAHPGSGSVSKRWPVEGFARVLGEFRPARRVAVFLSEGPADHHAVTALTDRLGGAAAGVLRGLELTELAGALVHASVYLGNDSGMSHLAAAVGAPCSILFEEARLAWQPWGSSAQPLVVTTSPLVPEDVTAVRDRVLSAVSTAMRCNFGRSWS
ncbi:MAG: glycosyltransferase family 9 protein [Candidatus Rokuibacteriota bacterium]